MTFTAIHQVLAGAAPGSATWNQASILRAALHGWGFRSNIYVGEAHASLRRETMRFASYRPRAGDALLYHFTTASPLADRIVSTDRPLILLYYNVTPPRYFANANPRLAAHLDRAQAQLEMLRPHVRLALAHSEFSRADLIAAGYTNIAVVPAFASEALFSAQPDLNILSCFDDGRVSLLSVGRLAPNKRHEDAIQALYHYRRIDPSARLFLAGAPDNAGHYVAWLRETVAALGLNEHVIFCGHVTDSQLAAYYRLAKVMLCMSEHEGFCVPLVEAMRFDVPILAYAAAAVPETLGGAGVLLTQKHYPIIAEMIDLLVSDSALRARIVARQRERAAQLATALALDRLRALLRVALEGAV